MGVIQTNVRELVDTISLSTNVRLERYRTDIAYAKRMIVVLQNDLNNLKSAEMLVLQRLNRTQKLSDIEKYYTSDRFQTKEPLQAIRPVDHGSQQAPDPRINWTRNQLTRDMEKLLTERDRLGSEIIKVSLEIQKQKQNLLQAQKDLQSLGGEDLSAQMEKDNISKRLYTEVYMLYEVYKTYKSITQAANGDRLYNSDAVTLKKMQKLNMLFQAYSQRNPYVLSGEIVLDYDDIGSDLNGKKLDLLMDRVRQVYTVPEADKLDPRLSKFSNLMYANLNDSYVSKDILREIDSKRVPPPDNALKTVLKDLSKSVSWAQENIVMDGLKLAMSWTAKSQADAVTRGFKKFISGVNNGLPYCSPTDPDPEEQQRAAQNAAQNQAEAEGAKIISTAFAKTKEVIPQESMAATIDNYHNNLITAINANDKDTGKGTPARYTLNIGSSAFTATVLYQVRILTIASRFLDYLISINVSGNLSTEAYENEVSNLVILLQGVNPPFIVSGEVVNSQVEDIPDDPLNPIV